MAVKRPASGVTLGRRRRQRLDPHGGRLTIIVLSVRNEACHVISMYVSRMENFHEWKTSRAKAVENALYVYV
jgi:hypothetical protein